MKNSNRITGRFVASALCCWFAANSAIGVPVVFDLRDTSATADIEDGTIIRGGITATLSALVQGNTGSLNQTASAFGVDALNNTTPHDAAALLDGVDGAESISITFDSDVMLLGLSLSGMSSGESGSLAIGANAVRSLVDTGTATDVYSFSEGNILPSGVSLILAWVIGNGFSFDSFTVDLWSAPIDPNPGPTNGVPDAGASLCLFGFSIASLCIVAHRRRGARTCRATG